MPVQYATARPGAFDERQLRFLFIRRGKARSEYVLNQSGATMLVRRRLVVRPDLSAWRSPAPSRGLGPNHRN
jgi:hypothetical protein